MAWQAEKNNICTQVLVSRTRPSEIVLDESGNFTGQADFMVTSLKTISHRPKGQEF
jgi:hypothetical protein